MSLASPPAARFPAALVALWVAAAPAPLAPAPAPVLLPTTLDAVLRRVAGRIAAAGLGTAPDRTITPARAIVSLDPEPYPAAGGPVAALRPGRFDARGGMQVGTGRFAAIKDGTFVVTLADQCLLDRGGHDYDRLLAPADPDAGEDAGAARPANLLLLAHQVEDLLTGEFVEDPAANLLSVEPLFFAGQGEPRRYASDDSWAAIDLTFTLAYIPRYNPR